MQRFVIVTPPAAVHRVHEALRAAASQCPLLGARTWVITTAAVAEQCITRLLWPDGSITTGRRFERYPVVTNVR